MSHSSGQSSRPGQSAATADPVPLALAWLVPVTTALLVRVALAYRPFPSIDDFAYIPLAWLANDPSLYPKDQLLHSFLLHAPLWRWAVRVSEASVGLPAGFWVLTFVLTLATVGAAYRGMRSLGALGFLLPLMAVLGFSGRVVGLGRGVYDGAMGSAFHVQWLALCALLWAYNAFARQKPVTCGAMLGLATLSHPVVGAHGAFVLAVASVAGPVGRWKRLVVIACVCAVVSAPVTLPLVHGLFAGALTASWPVADVIRTGYLFRAPHHYTLDESPAPALLAILLSTLSGVVGGLLLLRLRPTEAVRNLLGILAGHVVLVGAAVAWNAPWLEASWRYHSVLPYVLDLTRTSPMLLVVSAILAVAAVEVRLQRGGQLRDTERWLWWSLVVGLTTLLMVARWHPAYGVLLVVVALSAAMGRRWMVAAPAGLLAATAIMALGWSVRHDVLSAPISEAERQLYAWASGSTRRDALFIVPPGLEGFRTYARRGAYVDFKLFAASTPASVPEWRRRLEEVAAPDRRALETPGWEGVVFWDRTYATRNSPRRIAELLSRTGADFFVWDAHGLQVPPFVLSRRAPDPRIKRAFRNERFEVYRLSAPLVVHATP